MGRTGLTKMEGTFSERQDFQSTFSVDYKGWLATVTFV